MAFCEAHLAGKVRFMCFCGTGIYHSSHVAWFPDRTLGLPECLCGQEKLCIMCDLAESKGNYGMFYTLHPRIEGAPDFPSRWIRRSWMIMIRKTWSLWLGKTHEWEINVLSSTSATSLSLAEALASTASKKSKVLRWEPCRYGAVEIDSDSTEPSETSQAISTSRSTVLPMGWACSACTPEKWWRPWAGEGRQWTGTLPSRKPA